MTLKTQNRQSLVTDENYISLFGQYNKYEKLVNGLRDQTIPGEVRTYRMNDDGSRGDLLRTEYPV